MGHYETVCDQCFKVLSNPAYDEFDKITKACRNRKCPYKSKKK